MTDMERKRGKEQRVVREMIMLYCSNNHSDYKEGQLCSGCRELLDYAEARSRNCPFMEQKTFCSNCRVHCYNPVMREEIRKVMHFSGQRMLWHHPILALWHLITTRLEGRR